VGLQYIYIALTIFVQCFFFFFAKPIYTVTGQPEMIRYYCDSIMIVWPIHSNIDKPNLLYIYFVKWVCPYLTQTRVETTQHFLECILYTEWAFLTCVGQLHVNEFEFLKMS